jgi:hypothetical protein
VSFDFIDIKFCSIKSTLEYRSLLHNRLTNFFPTCNYSRYTKGVNGDVQGFRNIGLLRVSVSYLMQKREQERHNDNRRDRDEMMSIDNIGNSEGKE